MKIHLFGMPPAGEVAQLPEYGVGSMPKDFCVALASEYEKQYPGVYIIAGVDTNVGIFAPYHRTRQVWFHLNEIERLVLTPIGPAKGAGYVELGWENSTTEWPQGFLWSPTYSEIMHEWMRHQMWALSFLIGRSHREAPMGSDC